MLVEGGSLAVADSPVAVAHIPAVRILVGADILAPVDMPAQAGSFAVVDKLALAPGSFAVHSRSAEDSHQRHHNSVVAVAGRQAADKPAVAVVAEPVDIVLEVLRNFPAASAVLPALA